LSDGSTLPNKLECSLKAKTVLEGDPSAHEERFRQPVPEFAGRFGPNNQGLIDRIYTFLKANYNRFTLKEYYRGVSDENGAEPEIYDLNVDV